MHRVVSPSLLELNTTSNVKFLYLAECRAGERGMAVAFPPPFAEALSRVSMSLTAASWRPRSVEDGSAASAGLSILESDAVEDGEARNDMVQRSKVASRRKF